jgi:hypothetical protein
VNRAPEAPEQPVRPPAPPQPPIGRTLGDAARLIWRHPRATLLPFVAVQLPVAVVISAVWTALYLTSFKDDPYPTGALLAILNPGGSVIDTRPEGGAPLFAFFALMAAASLFTIIAVAASVVAVANAAKGAPLPVAQSLDPAFTRMGRLLMLAAMLLALLGAAVLSIFVVVGIVLAPYLVLRLGLSMNALMLEDLRPTDAIRRSWRMMKGHMLRLLAVTLLASLAAIWLVLISAPTTAFEDSSRATRLVVDAVSATAQGALGAPAIVFVTAVTTIFYLRLRAYDDSPRPA